MLSLLKIEWLKIKNYRTFWILTGLFAVFMPLFNYLLANGVMQMGPGGMNLSYAFPSVWGFFGFVASFFIVFIAFVIVILITNEHRYRTHRQNVIDGWSRLEFFHAKVLLTVKLAVLTTIYTGIWCLVFGAGYSGGFEHATQEMEKLFYFFLLCLNYYGFALMLSFLLKRSGLVIGLYMVYVLMVESIAASYLNWQFKGMYIGNFLPLQCSDQLLPFPLMKLAEGMMNQQAAPPPNYAYAIASGVYIILYYFISKQKLLKSDW